MSPRPLTFAVLTVLALLFSGVARAQDTLASDIPFAFDAGGKSMPAGRYDVLIEPDRDTAILTGPTGTRVPMLVVTRLAAPENPASKGRLVFDEVGQQRSLSELWVPGEDGYLLHATKGKHTHKSTALVSKGR